MDATFLQSGRRRSFFILYSRKKLYMYIYFLLEELIGASHLCEIVPQDYSEDATAEVFSLEKRNLECLKLHIASGDVVKPSP